MTGSQYVGLLSIDIYDILYVNGQLVLSCIPFRQWLDIKPGVLLQDYWHHWEDVCAGFVLGISIAYAFYRQQYPALTDAKAGYPIQAQIEGDSTICPHQKKIESDVQMYAASLCRAYVFCLACSGA